ncbi:hypothetical protein H632_c4378p0, partial [Helicosporidium sp. ATCC 50920]
PDARHPRPPGRARGSGGRFGALAHALGLASVVGPAGVVGGPVRRRQPPAAASLASLGHGPHVGASAGALCPRRRALCSVQLHVRERGRIRRGLDAPGALRSGLLGPPDPHLARGVGGSAGGDGRLAAGSHAPWRCGPARRGRLLGRVQPRIPGPALLRAGGFQRPPPGGGGLGRPLFGGPPGLYAVAPGPLLQPGHGLLLLPGGPLLCGRGPGGRRRGRRPGH